MRLPLLGLLLLAAAGHAAAADLSSVIAPGATVQKVVGDLRFIEGPAWDARTKSWLFSDIPADRLYRLDVTDTLSVAAEPSHNSNGNRIDAAGNRYSCEHETRQVTRTAPDGTRTVLAATFHGKAFNSPNDCVIANDGALWFTDPTYGLAKRPAEQTCHGVYRLTPGAAEPELMISDSDQPNGITFSPDGTTLYLADSGKPHHVRAFTVGPNHLPTAGRVFAVITPGVPDGMRCDTAGRLFVAAGDGVQVFTPDGTQLGTIAVPETPANCGFGGANGATLLITAKTSVYRIQLLTPGL